MSQARVGLGALWAIAFSLLLAFPAAAALTFPALTGRVVDDAHVLSPTAQADLTRSLADLEAKTSRQLVVVTLPSLQGDDIADYGYQLGRSWGIGQKQTNNGALFIIAPAEHQVRIEVGYGLEPILTDAMSNLILQRAVLPKFKAGDIEGGVVDGTAALVEQLGLDTSTAEAKAAAAARASARPAGRSNPIALLVFLVVMVFVVRGILGGGGGGGRGGGLGWFLPGLILGGLSGGRRFGDDDGFGGGGGGGGGFGGGGGGSFGGGGSSGSW